MSQEEVPRLANQGTARNSWFRQHVLSKSKAWPLHNRNTHSFKACFSQEGCDEGMSPSSLAVDVLSVCSHEQNAKIVVFKILANKTFHTKLGVLNVSVELRSFGSKSLFVLVWCTFGDIVGRTLHTFFKFALGKQLTLLVWRLSAHAIIVSCK